MKMSLYQQHRQHLENGGLIQYSGEYLTSKLIKLGTKQDFCHSAVVIRLPEYEHRVFSIEARKDGLHLWPLSDLLARYDGTCYYWPLRSAYKDEALAANRWLFAHLGCGYDFVDCVRNWRKIVGLRLPVADERRLYCSESIFLAYKRRCIDEYTGIVFGAGLPWLAAVKTAPVPGVPIRELIDVWGENCIKIL
jgi:hypothetical protein